MNEKPGISSSVIAAPPTTPFFSSTSVRSPALREVRRVGEAVVAAADDDRVVLVRGHACHRPSSSQGRRTASSWCVTRHRGVVVGDGQLEPQLGAGGRRGRAAPGRCRCAAAAPASRRSSCSSRPRRGRRRAPSTRRAAGARTSAGTGRRRGSSRSQSAQSTTMPVVAQRDVPSTSSRRIASEPTKRRDPSRTPRSIQPKPSSLGVTRSASLNASRRRATRRRSAASPASMRSVIRASSPNGRMLWSRPGLQHGVEHGDRVVRRARSARSRGHRCSRCATASPRRRPTLAGTWSK